VKALFDVRDSSGGRVYLFENGDPAGEISFSIGPGGVSLENPLPHGIKQTVLSLPASMLNFRLLEFPFTDVEKIRRAVPFELEGLVLKDIGEIIFDVVPYGQNGGGISRPDGSRVLVVYAEKSFLRGLIGSLSSLGAEPRAVTSLELRDIIARGADLGQALLSPEEAAPAGSPEARAHLAAGELADTVLNLRRGELSYTKETEEFGRSLKKTLILAGLLLLVLALKFGTDAYFLRKQAGNIELGIKQTYEKVLGQKPQSAAAVSISLKAKVNDLQKQEAELSGISPLSVLQDLTALKPRSVFFREIRMDAGPLTIKAEGQSIADAEATRNALRARFRHAEVLDTKSAEKTVLFTLRLQR
jgi:type II secretory pathway component PulL